jgi:hypothetical protein
MATAAFTVERAWAHAGYEGGIEDSVILVDGRRIGGAYWCSAGDVPDGQRWASYGPAGYSFRHPTREAAEQVQVREYATDPDLYDRINAQAAAEAEAEQAARDARDTAEQEQLVRRRLGDDKPGPTVWTLPAYHAIYAPTSETEAVAAWLRDQGVDDASGCHEMRVEQRATRLVLVYEAPTALAQLAIAMGQPSTGESRMRATLTHVATVTTVPAAPTAPTRPDLHHLFDDHWPARFPLIDFGRNTVCGACTKHAKAITTEQMVAWPCPTVAPAISGFTDPTQEDEEH